MKFGDKIASARRGLKALVKTVPYSEDLRRGLKVLVWINWISGAAFAGVVFTLCKIAAELLA